MFSSKDKVSNVKYDTLVSQKTEIKGELHVAGGAHIDGIVKGNIIAEPGSNATIRISERGRVEGQISAPNVIINGAVKGNVMAYDYLELAKKARIEGDITYSMMEIVLGAEVNGRLHQKGRKSDTSLEQLVTEEANKASKPASSAPAASSKNGQ